MYDEMNEGIEQPEDKTMQGSGKDILQVVERMYMQNICDDLEESELDEIALKVYEDYETDLASVEDWRETNEEATKIAMQTTESKSFPWLNASNVKFPLISDACIAYSSRALPEIIQGDKVAKARVIGKDEQEAKAERGERISEHMSYQLTSEIPNWETDMDKMLTQLPLIGCQFKEVTWDDINLRPKITLLKSTDLVVNYDATSLELEECRRISKEFTLFMSDIRTRESMELWREIDYTEQPLEGDEGEPIEEDQQRFIQQLRWCDLDGDGIEEPYKVVASLDSNGCKVVRITAMYDEDTLILDTEKTKVHKVGAYEEYVDYQFMPSFDGSFYGMGFGQYLKPLNEAINTLINQLIDQGTLASTGGGYVAKGIRSQMGSTSFRPGEWKAIDTKGIECKRGVYSIASR